MADQRAADDAAIEALRTGPWVNALPPDPYGHWHPVDDLEDLT